MTGDTSVLQDGAGRPWAMTFRTLPEGGGAFV